MPNQRAEGMIYIGAWCPEELVNGIEAWIKKEKIKRRVNRTDFLVEAATEKLLRDKISIQTSSAHRTGENRAQSRDLADVSQELLANDNPNSAIDLTKHKKVAYNLRRKHKPGS